jgi:hypothetical protein
MSNDGRIPARGYVSLEDGDSADSLLRKVVEDVDPLTGESSFAPPTLREGDVLANRFIVERFAGRGGMGTVYRALDRVSGSRVALKVLARRGQDDDRFAQEARVLSQLTHPAIVCYVAHGTTSLGQPFLAMEWLNGEDLAARLARAPLTAFESLAVVRRIAAGLSAAHARGVVHRDVKPSNVFLVDGEPERAKLLDFGIVRLTLSAKGAVSAPMTRTGTVLGTVGYMSPEQAIADRDLDARTDVFALGCMLYECLTGAPAFRGAHVVAVLAKVLREEAPRIRQLRPELSPRLDDLVARMLSKEKARRPGDGAAVLRELEALDDIVDSAPETAVRPSVGLSGGEQRLLTITLAIVPDEPDRVGEIVGRHGGDQVWLANGTLLVTLTGSGSTSDEVVSAAVCALELQQAFPSARFALATGRAQTTGNGPAGRVIDQAAHLLAQTPSPGVRIDDVTMGLLGERFEVRPDVYGSILVGRRSGAEQPRTLLGKPTPCVGREKELNLLDGTLRECIDESVARAVLVTGPPGQGKSRLKHEFVNLARKLGGVAILSARADPVAAGSAFILVRQIVRHAVGLREGDPVDEQHAKLRAQTAHVCRTGDAARIAEFLGELIGVPSTDRPSPELRAARNDPQIMAVWLARSFGEWLAGECAERPLLIVLEDLHWGDLPSVTYLTEGLRALAGRPLMLLALGRPEVHDVFPNLLATADKIEVRLSRLPPRAAERLVRAALGDTLASGAVTRLVAQADGNAFYLEELIRGVSEGGGEALPDTVLALAQLRMQRLEPEARRIVRAASIFGEVFWAGGVIELLGADQPPEDVHVGLRSLVEREVFVPVVESRFPGTGEFAFRHGLLREAAYAMLTDTDRVTGHLLAGLWLERAGERDAVRMASHFEGGEDPARALPWLLRATQTAIDGGNTQAAIALGQRGIACGPGDAHRGLLRMLQGQALALRGDWAPAVEAGREAMELLPTGDTQWFLCVAGVFLGGVFLGDLSVTAPILATILEVPVPPERSGPYGLAVLCTCMGLSWMGQLAAAQSFHARAASGDAGAPELDPSFSLMLHVARGFLELMEGNLGRAVVDLSEACVLTDRTGDAWGRIVALLQTVHALSETGSYERTERVAKDLVRFCEPIGLNYSDWGAYHVARAALNVGRAAEAVATLRPLVGRLDPMMSALSRSLLAHALVATGDLEAARTEADSALESGMLFAHAQVSALAALALVQRALGQQDLALASADRGLAVAAQGCFLRDESILRVEKAQSLRALGRPDEAGAAISEARERVLRVAATLGEPDLRQAFLVNVEANARTLALASQWLGAGAPEHS